ncbi:MAG: hypothetical protein Q9183_002455 [Haloplaca sp. 2 TL-2023]
MATIKAIEDRSVHQIQSGQVIVDLCSVVKELLENSLDAGATSIEVRFKGNGLESIEVQDNGTGISPENYASIALKHHTSKLATYHDLSSLQTFGFRGEALSSLCALSNFHIVTARLDDAPKGTRLDFETSGKLKATSVLASQKGTTVAVEALFATLPVRRRELEKNIKREYGKVLVLLQAYACISTSVKLSVSNVVAKGKKTIVFATKSNVNTRESIANVFGAKTLSALVPMDLEFELQHTRSVLSRTDAENSQVRVLGHVSKPVFGEGRQTPDRQMFFVNARPCTLPQFAKVFNEVYKSYNLSQSPFIFANLVIDTNAYDVNVSPDKRTILLHDQPTLLNSLRSALVDLFERQDQTVPQTQRNHAKLPTFKPLKVDSQDTTDEGNQTNAANSGHMDPPSDSDGPREAVTRAEDPDHPPHPRSSLIEEFAGRDVRDRPVRLDERAKKTTTISERKMNLASRMQPDDLHTSRLEDECDRVVPAEPDAMFENQEEAPNPVTDFNKRMAEIQQRADPYRSRPFALSESRDHTDEEPEVAVAGTPVESPAPGVVPNAFERMRPRRLSPQVATITIGDKTTTALLGTTSSQRRPRPSSSPPGDASDNASGAGRPVQRFSSSMQAFAAPGSHLAQSQSLQTAISKGRHSSGARTLASQQPVATTLSTQNTYSTDGSGNDTDVPGDIEANGDPVHDEVSSHEGSDDEYLDEEGRKAKQDAKVTRLIEQAEEKSSMPTEHDVKRAAKIMHARGSRESTTQLLQTLNTSVSAIEAQLTNFERDLQSSLDNMEKSNSPSAVDLEEGAEQKLSLTISKSDFSRMNIIGQFNLGFILASRPSTSSSTDEELFIIDQHASDEKYNFERLQATTTVQNQRLVQPKVLDLTAIEEEIIIESKAALTANGFVVEVDESGDTPVGKRCKLISLPMSKEVTFDLSDLEELIALLGDSPASLSLAPTFPSTPSSPFSQPNDSNPSKQARYIPRPSRIRKLFAMRACRSSVMIGRTLQKKDMNRLVKHMGEIEKPWNCPHGRPTMRHLYGLSGWEGWKEGDGLVGEDGAGQVDWAEWLEGQGDKEDDWDTGEGEEGSGDEEGIEDDDMEVENNDEQVDMDQGGYRKDGEDVDMALEESGDETGAGRRFGSISQRFGFFG